MTKHEKLSLALSHRTGPVPLDIGSTSTTGIHVSIVEKLREYYGLEKRPVRVQEPMQMLGVVDSDLKEALGIDTIGVWNPNTSMGVKTIGEKEWRAPWGQILLVPEAFITTTDSSGSLFAYAQGDINYPPCAKMPAGGYFFDIIVRGHDYNEDDPHVEDNLEEFKEISNEVLDCIRSRLLETMKTPYARVGSFGGTAVGDIALVPGGMLKQPKGLRDIAEWYMATLTTPLIFSRFFSAMSVE